VELIAAQAPASDGRAAEETAGWRLMAGPILVALVTLVVGLVACAEAGFSFRDPDHVAALYVVEVGVAVALLVLLDVFIRTRRATGRRWPSRSDMGAVRRERWTAKRLAMVGGAIVAFYATYLAYRNLKASVPLLRPELFDADLADVDRAMFFGTDPAAILHDLLGTGMAAHVLSTLYVAFIVFLPLSLALALVFAERIAVSLFYATAMSINWIIGAASYLILPALGPIYADPGSFSALPHTEVTHLQELLMTDRVGFLADAANGTPQAIAAFASLHIAMSVTTLVMAYMLGLGKWVKRSLWVWNAITVIATVYLGWHYVLDDIAGIGLGIAAIYLAIWLTGFDPREARSPARRQTVPSPAT